MAKGHSRGKPRPALIVQADPFGELQSVTVCLLSSELVEAPLLRLTVEPGADNGLDRRCQIQIDKLPTVPRARIGRRIGVSTAKPWCESTAPSHSSSASSEHRLKAAAAAARKAKPFGGRGFVAVATMSARAESAPCRIRGAAFLYS